MAAGAVVGALGCQKERGEVQDREAGKSQMHLVDALGREIVLEKTPQRLISLAPNITEILFAVGLGDKVVGVTSWDNYPPQVAKIERVGDYGNPNLEKIIWLKADLVLVAYGVPKSSIEAMEKHGLKVMALPDDSLEDVAKSMRMVVAACGDAASSFEARVAAVTGRTASLQPSEHPKVLFLISLEPIMCVGSKTFISDMIEKAGGVNLGASFGENYPNVSAEALVEKRPDMLFLAEDLGKKAKTQEGKEILRKLGLVDVPAHALADDLTQRPGPRAVEGLEEMARLLHPGVFAPLK